MSYVSEEIASQPACWRRAIELAAGSPAGLPLPGERVAVVGCGTSLFMAQSYAALREAAGLGETDAFPASEYPVGRGYDRVLAITRSGTTSEVLAVLDLVRDRARTVAITADPATPVAQAARDLVVLDFADERSVVQTRFATTALMLLRAHLKEDLDRVVDQATHAVSAPLPAGAVDRRQVTFLGSGWTVGVAHEAALKLREAAQAWTDSYPAMEYRHGPISLADHDTLVWVFGAAPDGLLADVARTGAAAEVSTVDPLADLIRAQRLAVALAEARGLDADRPRHLTRSVILT